MGSHNAQHLQSLLHKLTSRISQDIGRLLNSSESFLNAMSERVLKSMGGAVKGIANLSPDIIKGAVFAARDALGSVTGVVRFVMYD